MSDESTGLLSSVPPWGWVVIYMTGGSAIGVGGAEVAHTYKATPEIVECADSESVLEEAQNKIKKLRRDKATLEAEKSALEARATALSDLLSQYSGSSQ